MSDHAKLSPSARHRWGKCPGSVREEARYPDGGGSSPAAVDGTHTHTLLEYCVKRLMGGLDGNAAAFIGITLNDHEGDFTVDAARAERVEFAMNYIRERSAVQPNIVKSEERVNPKYLLGRDDMDGTVDVQIIGSDTLEIIDYKDGMGVVSACGNPQLEQYGFGALAPLYESGNMTIKRIRMTIIQPKLREKGYDGINFHEMELSEFLTKYSQLIAEANATDAKDAPLIPGEEQCRYCAHSGNCSAKTAEMFAKSGIKFEAVESATTQVALLSANDLPEDKLRDIVEALPMLRKWLEEVEDAALKRIQSGKPIPGLKVVRGRGLRSWSGTEEEIAAKLNKMGVPKGDIWVTKLVSPAQVEKLRWTKRDGTVKQLNAKQLEVVHNDMVSKSEGKLAVVSAADTRPAVDFGDVGAMFAPVEQLPTWLT